MERIQAAIQKAKERRGDAEGPLPPLIGAGAATRGRGPGPAWAELAAFEPDPKVMTRNRIVTYADTDPSHTAFDMLRTKILRTMRANGWISLGITSPTADCGKTTLALNLAFGLAHQPDLRTVLVDLDLRRPAVAKTLGLEATQSMAAVLKGASPVAENFVRYGETLAIGTNAASMRESAELLLNPATSRGVAALGPPSSPTSSSTTCRRCSRATT